MPDAVARFAVWILAAIFAWAGLAKILSPLAWREALDVYHLPPTTRRLAAGLVPLLELAVPFFVLGGGTRAGVAVAIGVLAGGSLMVLRARSFEGDAVPCGCFGSAKPRDYRVLLGRNAAIGILAAIVALSPEDVVSRQGLFSHVDVFPLVLIAIGAVAIGVLIRAGDSLGRWQR